eukprot:7006-Chlamydomonas_euryale.AAC.1
MQAPFSLCEKRLVSGFLPKLAGESRKLTRGMGRETLRAVKTLSPQGSGAPSRTNGCKHKGGN